MDECWHCTSKAGVEFLRLSLVDFSRVDNGLAARLSCCGRLLVPSRLLPLGNSAPVPGKNPLWPYGNVAQRIG